MNAVNAGSKTKTYSGRDKNYAVLLRPTLQAVQMKNTNRRLALIV